MAKTNWQDPQSTEIRSTHISGLQDAVKKLEEAVNLSTISETNVPLNYVLSYNPETGEQEYRIYQAPEGKRNWLVSPAPVIKKNGVVITDGFTIDYGGGAIILSPAATANDVFTADVTYTTNKTEPAYFEDEFTSSIYSLSDTVEKGQLSVGIQGNTYTNLCGDKGRGDSLAGWARADGISTSGGYFNVDPTAGAVRGHIPFNVISGHKYYISTIGNSFNGTTGYTLGVVLSSGAGQSATTQVSSDRLYLLTPTDVNFKKVSGFLTATENGDCLNFGRFNLSGDNLAKYRLQKIMVIDLTAMGLDSLTLEECDKRFSNYIDNTKSTISAQRFKALGKNLFDKEKQFKALQTIQPTVTRYSEGSADVVRLKMSEERFVIKKGGFKQNQQYTFTFRGRRVVSNLAFRITYTDGTIVSTNPITSTTFQTVTFTSAAGKTISVIESSWVGEDAEIDLNATWLEEGTISTSYEEYVESNMYIKATDENGNILPMRSVPSANDEISEGKYIQRVNKYVVQGGELSNYTSLIEWNIETVRLNIDNLSLNPTGGANLTGKVIFENANIYEVSYNDRTTVNPTGLIWYSPPSSNYIYIGAPQGTWGSLAAAQTALAGVTLNYQLATPVVTNATVVGHLDSYPNGTIIVEPIVADFDFYDAEDGIIIQDINIPIKSLSKVLWTDKETGIEVDITDTCTVSQDGLSFTSTYAIDGDLIWYEYEYDSSMTTLPTVSIEAPLNSKAALIGAVKGVSEAKDKIDNVDLRVQGLSKRVDNTPASIFYTIAPFDAVNKERADLVLTGVPADDLAAINNALTMLHTMRASVDVAIRIDFLGGTIYVGTKTDGDAIVIPVGYDNIHLYGNGVKLTGDVYDSDYVEIYSVFTNNADNVIINGFNIVNNAGDQDCGLYNTGTNCTITGNTCNASVYGLYNSGNNCTITGNTCNASGYGLYNGSTSTTDKCIITGNICLFGGISVKTGTCLPATQAAMADVNTGIIEIRP